MTTDACSPVPALTGRFDGIDLSLLDLNDEHDRSLLILAEHPELHAAIRSGREQIHHHGRVVNSAPHLAMHEIVANQLLANEPAEMWDTAKRLIDDGYQRHAVLHMLARSCPGMSCRRGMTTSRTIRSGPALL